MNPEMRIILKIHKKYQLLKKTKKRKKRNKVKKSAKICHKVKINKMMIN